MTPEKRKELRELCTNANIDEWWDSVAAGRLVVLELLDALDAAEHDRDTAKENLVARRVENLQLLKQSQEDYSRLERVVAENNYLSAQLESEREGRTTAIIREKDARDRADAAEREQSEAAPSPTREKELDGTPYEGYRIPDGWQEKMDATDPRPAGGQDEAQAKQWLMDKYHWHDDNLRIPVASGNHYPSLYELLSAYASSIASERDALRTQVEKLEDLVSDKLGESPEFSAIADALGDLAEQGQDLDLAEQWQQRAEKAEQRVASAYEMIRILWKHGTFAQAIGNALSEDGVLREALRAAKKGDTQ